MALYFSKVEAVQIIKKKDGGVGFNEYPQWILDAIETGAIQKPGELLDPDGVMVSHTRYKIRRIVSFCPVGDYVVNENGYIFSMSKSSFETKYERAKE